MKENKTLLELTSDPVFKAFMMSENTKVFKARYISLITGIKEEDLLNAEYTSRELAVNNKQDKTYKSDIIVHIEKTYLNIEMNNEYYKGVLNKNTSYLNKIRGDSYNKGDNYLDIERVIQINIDNYTKYNGNKLLYEFSMREKETGEIEQNNLISYHIDLAYLNDKCYTIDEIKKMSELEKMSLIFLEKQEELNMIRGEKGMEEAINELELLSNDEKIIGLYDAEAVERKIMNTRLLDAENRGMKQGKKETSIEIAKSLLQENIDINIISKSTGLTLEEISKL